MREEKSIFKKVRSDQKLSEMEKEILDFWEREKIFEKSLSKREGAEKYAFYDGPPFATGTPHYGHIVGSIMKDIVPRYWTMRGKYVERKWGWDCHGLPIENIVEKELGSKKKKDIEAMGVDKFNELCRSKVFEYVDIWEKVIKRLGRWADMKNAYRTMDLDYMESVWWVFKELWDRGLIYKDYRSMHICPRCETTLSQQEVSEGYKDIKDLSVIAKFELVDESGTFVLAWTTTPWTLPGNVALAVGSDIDYVELDYDGDGFSEIGDNNGKRAILEKGKYILAKDIFWNSATGQSSLTEELRMMMPVDPKEFEKDINSGISCDDFCEKYNIRIIRGRNLVGKKYKPLFDAYAKDENLKKRENGWKIYAADFVTTEDGTGVVHIAPAFGEDDMRLGKENNLPFVQHVAMDGSFKEEMRELAGLNVKPIENPQATDVEIIKYLAKNGTLFHKEKYEHSYPHCWRCDTPLINYATESWFVAVTKIKDKILELAKNINWSPDNMKEGRFGNWLEGARDWSISRQRFWASVMPIWICDKCGEIKVFGSVAELEKISEEKINDLHKHVMDKIIFDCQKCEGKMKRVPDVLDTWFDSGSMPYAQKHYPFENKEQFEQNFPADFIAEGVDQTRAWFYYLHVIAGGIKKSHAFRNVIVNGIVLAEDGKKMAKKLKNYPDPMEMFEKYGADSVRYYLMSSPVVAAQNLNFSERDVREIVRGMMRMLWNSYSFFTLYAVTDNFVPEKDFKVQKTENLLDRWIVSEWNFILRDFNVYMENYELHKAVRLLPKFADDLSNWYIRRSRKRFWKSENDSDKKEAYQTLHYLLVESAKVMAPIMPFLAEEIYKNLSGEESVHLADFSMADENIMDEKLSQKMSKTRIIITEALQLRAKSGIKVRQPLMELRIVENDLGKEFAEIIKDELNVKKVNFAEKDKSGDENFVWNEDGKIGLNIELTRALKMEGEAREIVRFIQEMRKEAGYEVDNRINVFYSGENAIFSGFGEYIAKETLAEKLETFSLEDGKVFDLQKNFKIGNEDLRIGIKKNKEVVL